MGCKQRYNGAGSILVHILLAVQQQSSIVLCFCLLYLLYVRLNSLRVSVRCSTATNSSTNSIQVRDIVRVLSSRKIEAATSHERSQQKVNIIPVVPGNPRSLGAGYGSGSL